MVSLFFNRKDLTRKEDLSKIVSKIEGLVKSLPEVVKKYLKGDDEVDEGRMEEIYGSTTAPSRIKAPPARERIESIIKSRRICDCKPNHTQLASLPALNIICHLRKRCQMSPLTMKTVLSGIERGADLDININPRASGDQATFYNNLWNSQVFLPRPNQRCDGDSSQ
ncbi:hypothetical protein O181_011617 [Austropuccinia psidii MF-1]|uniref:Uncharacterized protein n=1 Tax=Austropuccinia psidii MF-1 TaxID=1389203 RepID=A0A9Q3BW22_9BASI|nr:hypothetical protein [Austropuccinia psidii MF-1]